MERMANWLGDWSWYLGRESIAVIGHLKLMEKVDGEKSAHLNGKLMLRNDNINSNLMAN